MKWWKALLIPFKGFLIGSSMTVPGVSGGTMAILLGIYDQLIGAISRFTKEPKKNFLFLVKFCAGAVVGIGSLALALDWLLEVFPIPVSFFFLGAVIGGIPALYRKTRATRFKVSSAVYILLGLGIVLGIGMIPQNLLPFSAEITLTNLLIWLLAGLVVAIALVLPGISTSHMLLVLGIYETVLAAVKNLQLGFLALLVVSTLVGVILITRPLEWTMNKFPHQTYCMIMGFVVGSLADIVMDIVLPALQAEAALWQWVITAVVSVITLVAGAGGILFLSRFSDEG